VSQHITTDEPLDDLTFQGHLNDRDDRQSDAIGEDQRDIVHIARMRCRGGRADSGHVARGQMELLNDLWLDRGPRSSRVDERGNFHWGWNGFALLSKQVGGGF